MTEYMQVRLTPWALQRIRKDYCKTNKVTKAALRQSLRDLPGTEFHTIASVVQRGGAVVTVAEAAEAGFHTLEVRLNDDYDVAVVVIHPTDGTVVVR